MPGTLTIARKEFVDHVTDKTFILCFGILLIVMTGSTFYQVQEYSTFKTYRQVWLDFPYLLHYYLTTQLSSLGAILAITLGINSISGERTEGTLKVLLSYPIYKDKVIVGKLLAGIILVSIITTASMAIAFSIMAFYISIPLTIDLIFRVTAVIAMGIVLLTFFLCLGTAVSTVVKDTSASLMILLLAIFLMSGNTLWLGVIVLGILFPGFIRLGNNYYEVSSYPTSTSMISLFRNYSWVSPVEAYNHFSMNIFQFVPGWGSETMLTFEGQLYKNLDLLAVPLVFTIFAFIACYLLFTRSDVT